MDTIASSDGIRKVCCPDAYGWILSQSVPDAPLFNLTRRVPAKASLATRNPEQLLIEEWAKASLKLATHRIVIIQLSLTDYLAIDLLTSDTEEPVPRVPPPKKTIILSTPSYDRTCQSKPYLLSHKNKVNHYLLIKEKCP